MIVIDETMSGQQVNRFEIEGLDESLTVREIIRARIWQEVHEYNALKASAEFTGLVKPAEIEQRLKAPKHRAFRAVDWELQLKSALEAFERNGFFMLIDERQAESLDEVFTVGPETEVSFVKLVPLVGG